MFYFTAPILCKRYDLFPKERKQRPSNLLTSSRFSLALSLCRLVPTEDKEKEFFQTSIGGDGGVLHFGDACF